MLRLRFQGFQGVIDYEADCPICGFDERALLDSKHVKGEPMVCEDYNIGADCMCPPSQHMVQVKCRRSRKTVQIKHINDNQGGDVEGLPLREDQTPCIQQPMLFTSSKEGYL